MLEPEFQANAKLFLDCALINDLQMHDREGTMDKVEVTRKLILGACQMESWPQSLPHSFQITRTYRPDCKHCYGEYCETYQSTRIAATWMTYRATRIVTLRMILHKLHEISSSKSLTQQYGETDDAIAVLCTKIRARLAELSTDIVRTLPFYIRTNSEGNVTPVTTGGNWHFWYFYMACMLPEAPSDLKPFVLQELQRIQAAPGGEQVAVIVVLISQGIDVFGWAEQIGTTGFAGRLKALLQPVTESSPKLPGRWGMG